VSFARGAIIRAPQIRARCSKTRDASVSTNTIGRASSPFVDPAQTTITGFQRTLASTALLLRSECVFRGTFSLTTVQEMLFLQHVGAEIAGANCGLTQLRAISMSDQTSRSSVSLMHALCLERARRRSGK